MTCPTGSAAVKFTAHAPELFVADVAKACDFYSRKLGFRVVFTYGDPPYYGAVVRDAVTLNLRLICEPVFAGDVREREELLSATIIIGSAGDMRRLDADLAAAGAGFRERLTQKPWGALNVIVRDPDGNLILFAGPGA